MNDRAKTFIARSSFIAILVGATFVGADESEAEAAANPVNECLYYNVHKTYKSKFWGKSADDRYPMNGKTPTRVDLTVNVKGHGNATINQQDSDEVVVHYWYDLFTKVSYDLRVWVEC